MTDCIFCKIIANHVSSYTVFENDETRAFLDIMPSAPGHTVVTAKRHADKIFDYTKKELGEVMQTVSLVASGLEKTFNTKILSIGINHGEPSGVRHLHVHIIPRSPNDHGGVMQSLVVIALNETLEEIQERIIKQI
jgi:histidine triad (HIT) family protein